MGTTNNVINNNSSMGDELTARDKFKIEHDTLLKELHNIDHITEIHAATIIAISSVREIYIGNKRRKVHR